MLATTGPTFAASLKDEIASIQAEITLMNSLLRQRSASHWVVNESLCIAAKRVSRLHGYIVEHSLEVEQAREAKREAVERLESHEEKYSEACHELERFLRDYDIVGTQV
jgi:hypothetical protein